MKMLHGTCVYFVIAVFLTDMPPVLCDLVLKVYVLFLEVLFLCFTVITVLTCFAGIDVFGAMLTTCGARAL